MRRSFLRPFLRPVLFAVLMVLAFLLRPVSARAGDADPARLLGEIDARAARVESLRFGVVRVTDRNGVRIEERWRFVSAPGGRFRVDYSGDTQREIAFNGKILWDYLPSARKARRVDLAALPEAERNATLRAVMEKVAVPGFRIGVDAAAMTWTETPVPEGMPQGTMAFQGVDSKGRIEVVLGGDGAWIDRCEIWTNGSFVLSIVASEHQQIAPDTWFPREVKLEVPEKDRRVTVTMHVSQVVTGEHFPDGLFELSPDSSVAVERSP
jgi:outer membrane lipoprotein-sorting protein